MYGKDKWSTRNVDKYLIIVDREDTAQLPNTIYYAPPVVDVMVPVLFGQNPSGSFGASLGAKPASTPTMKQQISTIGTK